VIEHEGKYIGLGTLIIRRTNKRVSGIIGEIMINSSYEG
jgi:hypothetical protein